MQAETTIYFVVWWVLFECSSFDHFPNRSTTFSHLMQFFVTVVQLINRPFKKGSQDLVFIKKIIMDYNLKNTKGYHNIHGESALTFPRRGYLALDLRG